MSQNGVHVTDGAADAGEFAQIALDSIDDAIIGTNLAGHVAYLNRVAERMIGWSREAALGRPLDEVFRIVDGTHRATALNRAALAIRQNSAVRPTANGVLIRRDGFESAIEDSVAPIHDRKGHVTGAVMVLRDVSQTRATSPAESHCAQHDYLTDWPNRPPHNGHKATNSVGQWLPGNSSECSRPPEGRYPMPQTNSRFQGLMVPSNPVEQDFRQLNERLILSNEQLAAANADLEAFSYSVAHDLRAPIRQIAGFSKILAEEYGLQLPAEARRYLDKVAQGAQQMGTLVDDLLHLAQVGRQALSLQLTPLDSILAAAVELLRPECLGRNIQWRIGALYNVACDRGLMKQAFVNLLSNALKYTRPRDPAVIEVGQMSLKGEQVIFVRDNGVGFDMQYAGKLFGVFQRLHRASEFDGTGIGLATVERIVRKHGGRIWAQAEPGLGATFFFTMPPGVQVPPGVQ